MSGVSTPACYKAFDAMGGRNISGEEKTVLKEELSASSAPVDRLRQASARWTNDLQAPAIDRVPEIEEGIALLRNGGAVFSAMSGSGSAVFGIFEDEETIGRLMETPEFRRLTEAGWWSERSSTL
jgi:4-diphosphocytidyl-2-C-methyl-D-erythritol kinase